MADVSPCFTVYVLRNRLSHNRLSLVNWLQEAEGNRRREEISFMEELQELTLPDIYLLLESLKYSRMNIENGSAPPSVKQSRLEDIAAVTAKLRALRDDMKRHP